MAACGLDAAVRCADAESLPYDSGTFDFVWSWGVIHHSARTSRIVREIARVLRPYGEARVMVYNRDGMSARYMLARFHLLNGGFMRRSADETLWQHTDGFSARYYYKEQFEDLFRGFFDEASCVILGQEPDVVPLPHRVRRVLAPRISDARKLAIASHMGSFLFLTASHPLQ